MTNRDPAETIWDEFVAACESVEDEASKGTQLVSKTFAEFHYHRGRLEAAKSIRRSVPHPKYRPTDVHGEEPKR